MTDVKALVTTAQQSKLDGANHISSSEYAQIKNAYRSDPQSTESIKWLQNNQPQLFAAITSDLDYSGYVGTSNGSLNSTRAGEELAADAGRRQARLDRLPPVRDYRADGMPKGTSGADVKPPHPENGQQVRGYDTGSNYTNVVGDKLTSITDAQAQQSRQTQRDFCTKMSGVIGADVANPPSVNAAKAYFQRMADRGASTQEIKGEYDAYLKTFYKHPGGVAWSPALNAQNVNERFNDQPLAKDGKRLIDCEGFSVLTESVLGGVQKNGQPMFDVKHAANGGHVVCGVFPRGQDPSKGFVVDNAGTTDLRLRNPQETTLYNQTADRDTRERYLLRTYMGANHGSPATQFGSSYDNMQPPPSKR